MKAVSYTHLDVYKRQVLQTGEDIGVKHIIADIMHGALACALSVLATMIMAVRLAVLPVDVYKRQIEYPLKSAAMCRTRKPSKQSRK